MITDFKQLHTFCRENNIPYKVEGDALGEGVAPILNWAFDNNKKNIYEKVLSVLPISSQEKHNIIYSHFIALTNYAYKDAHSWLDIVLQHHTKDAYQEFLLKKLLENSIEHKNNKLITKVISHLQHVEDIHGLGAYFCIKHNNEQSLELFLKSDVPLVVDKMTACKVNKIEVSPFYVSLVEEALFNYKSPESTINKLLDYFKNEIDANDYMGYLIKCVNKKDMQKLQFLWHNDVFQKNKMNFTSQDLINNNIDHSDTNSQFKYGTSYLQMSLEMVNDLQYYDYFMSIGFDVKDALNSYARIALRDNDVYTLQQLKQRNYKINDYMGNLLYDAIYSDHKEVAQFLMQEVIHNYYKDNSVIDRIMGLNVSLLKDNNTAQYVLDNAPENFVQTYMDSQAEKYDEEHNAWLLGAVLKREAQIHNPQSLQRKSHKKI